MIHTLPFYRVGGETFANKFYAYRTAKETGLPMEFDFYDSAFSNADWTHDPTLTWDQLLDIRAHQLSNKGKQLILNFSGGTDSYTIYEVFRRNKLHIDYFYLNIKDNSHETGGGEKDAFEGTIKFFNTVKEDFPDSKIVISNTTKEMMEKFYSDPDWVWKDGFRIFFSQGMYESFHHDKNPDFEGLDSDHISIYGYEKPRLKIIGNKFYSFQEDTTIQGSMNNLRNHYFFISPELPELHIKQSYMLAKYIKGQAVLQNKPLEHYNTIHHPDKHDYYEYSYVGTGRFGDYANSGPTKIRNRESWLYIPDGRLDAVQHQGRYHGMLVESLKNNDKFVMNYLKGLYELRNDSLVSGIFEDVDGGNYYSVINYQSKYHQLNI